MRIYIPILVLAAACAAPVAAASGDEIRQQQGVQFKDLDLSTEAGRKELDRRLDGAAREVCGIGENLVGSRIASAETRKCYRDALRELNERTARLTGRSAVGA